MSLLGFVKDRAIFFSLIAIYVVWKETCGQDHWKTITSCFTDFELIMLNVPVSLISYFVTGVVFAYFDFCIAPFQDPPGERLQPEKAHTSTHYKRVLPVVLFNLYILNPLLNVAALYVLSSSSPYNTDKKTGNYDTLPPLFNLLGDLAACMLIREMIFYYLHRLFHYSDLLRPFHRKHHEFSAPIAISALFADPLDFAVTNLFPLLVGPMLFDIHPVTIWLYTAEAIIETVATHSGYVCPGFPNAERHDFHHETYTSNFSLIGLGDYLHGTDIKFKLHMANKAHAFS